LLDISGAATRCVSGLQMGKVRVRSGRGRLGGLRAVKRCGSSRGGLLRVSLGVAVLAGVNDKAETRGSAGVGCKVEFGIRVS
jgi:hypothetical protein